MPLVKAGKVNVYIILSISSKKVSCNLRHFTKRHGVVPFTIIVGPLKVGRAVEDGAVLVVVCVVVRLEVCTRSACV